MTSPLAQSSGEFMLSSVLFGWMDEALIPLSATWGTQATQIPLRNIGQVRGPVSAHRLSSACPPPLWCPPHIQPGPQGETRGAGTSQFNTKAMVKHGNKCAVCMCVKCIILLLTVHDVGLFRKCLYFLGSWGIWGKRSFDTLKHTHTHTHTVQLARGKKEMCPMYIFLPLPCLTFLASGLRKLTSSVWP